MSMSNTLENGLALLLFNGTALANIAQNGTSPITQIANALHTADPGETGNMSTSEAAYTSYARADVNRNSGGWTVTNNSVSPVANIDFPLGSGGSGTASYWSTGKTGGGSADILLSGAISPTIAMGNGVTPRLSTATAIVFD